MMLKRNAPKAKSPGLLGRLRMTGAALVAAVSTATLVVGCLDRPVVKQSPHTSNVFVAEIRQTAVDKIDLLFMIDNSISMADKQAVLADAVPVLLNRLVQPVCVNTMGEQTGAGNMNGTCPNGSSPEFSPIKDIHIGVVSSSLGAHGGQTCATTAMDQSGDDKGQLVQKVRPTMDVQTWNGPTGPSGFLAWDPDTQRPRNTPPGETNPTTLTTNFRNMVIGVGQSGCGYEGSLEAWYRFLIDPQPPTSVPQVADPGAPGAATTPVYDNNAQTNPILQQRAQFLRSDSLLAVIMLSDENDCSIVDAGQGFLVGVQNLGGGAFHMPRSTSVCETNPNDKCCRSCASGAPAGCAADPVCDMQTLSATDDNLNLRCYDQKRRFGFDLLYSTQRYVDGLWETQIPNRDGMMVQNPIYTGSPPRDKSLVFLAGIIGVPWQDVSTTASHAAGAPLKYLTYQEMLDQGRWDLILGNPGNETTPPQPPGDKLMFETPKDRTTLFGNAPHPLIGDAMLANAGTMGRPNSINGHESNIADNSDLQYACIFKLPETKNCAMGAAACDCKTSDQGFNRPLCNGTTQEYAKAYPGTRELRVLKDYGAKGTQNSIVASICPKTLSNMQDASYGYNPAVAAIIDRLKEALRGKCLPRKLNVEDDGTVPCAVVEANVPANPADCSCENNPMKPGRENADDELKAAVYRQLSEAGYCGDAMGATPCANYCLCKISQFTGDQLNTCQTSASTPTNIFGYCYVDPSTATDPAKQMAEEQIVSACPASQKRLLRFAGDGVPAKGSIAMIACIGSTVAE
jgi:hypothetical protein